MKTRLHEVQALVAMGEAALDNEARTIANVALLGQQSKNVDTKTQKPRRYSEAALTEAAPRFEGAKVFLDHGKTAFGKTSPRSVRDFVGRLSEVKFEEGQLRAGKLKVVNSEFWPMLSDFVLHDQNAVGLSIDAYGVMKENVVTQITAVNSVDLVSAPATVKGLFEERDKMDYAEVTVAALQEHRSDLVEELTKGFKEKLVTVSAELAKLKESTTKEADESATDAAKALQAEAAILKEEAAVLRLANAESIKLSDVQFKALTSLTEATERAELMKSFKAGTKLVESKGADDKGDTTASEKSLLACFAN